MNNPCHWCDLGFPTSDSHGGRHEIEQDGRFTYQDCTAPKEQQSMPTREEKLAAMTPDQVCGYIRKQIRKRFGDDVENASKVYARHGFYYVELPESEGVNVQRASIPELVKKLDEWAP